MKKIPLTRGTVSLVDDHDYEYLTQWKWYAHSSPTPSKYYAARTQSKPAKAIWMHRVVAERAGMDISMTIDHIDRNPLNNQRGNLRPATQQQQSRNQSIRNNNTSGYKGVCWHKQHGKWRVRITINGKYIHLGYYTLIQAAANAYRKAAIRYFGEFATIN